MNTNELVIIRTFPAPRKLVWRAWTEPELCMRWWGPKDFSAPACKIDLRVGGSYLNCMRSPEGKDYWSTGVYRELVEPERIVSTDSFADPQGNPVPASYYGMDDFPQELEITVSFQEEGGVTRMVLRHVGIPPATKGECEQGWNESFDKLAALLAQEVSAG